MTPRATVHRRHLLAASFGGLCLGHATAQPTAGGALLVAASASLADAMREIAAAWAAATGRAVQVTAGASGALLQQLAAGAPIDVLVTSDQATMDQAEARGLVDRSVRRVIARNRLVVVVPASAAALSVPSAPRAQPSKTALELLTTPRFARLAIGTPGSVPAGRYAQQALEAAGVWPALQPKLVGAANVRQVLDYVARGEADAGFVYATDAAQMLHRVRVAFEVPTLEPIAYPAAPTRRAGLRNPQAAGFVEHLLGARAQAVLRRLGFGAP